MTSRKRLLTGAITGLCLVVLLVWQSSSNRGLQARSSTLQAGGELRWYRGNMHTHSHWSDGDDYLEMIALWYREHGYQFLVFTDHNVLADKERWVNVAKTKGKREAFDKLRRQFPDSWVNERMAPEGLEVRLKTFAEVSQHFNEAGEYLLIQGEEVSDALDRFPIHMNASNVRELVVPRHGTTVEEVIQNNTDALVAQRERTGQPMIIHLNHPNFGFGVTAEDLMRIRGENFFEVYNGHPTVYNSGNAEHAGTERIWDIINTRRLTEFGLPLLYGLGTDDGHNYHHPEIPNRSASPGRGWVMVLASELTPEALIDAMEQGKFYASSGVTLATVTSSPTGLEVEVQPDPEATYQIEFIGTRKGFDPSHTPVLDKNGKPIRATEQYSPDIGATFQQDMGTKAKYEFTGDELYVRARITSSHKHPNPSEPGEPQRAWTQPTRGPAAPAAE